MKRIYAGYWMALLNRRDALHGLAKRLSLVFAKDSNVTSGLVLTEVLNGFSGGSHLRAQAAMAIADLRVSPTAFVVSLADISLLKKPLPIIGSD